MGIIYWDTIYITIIYPYYLYLHVPIICPCNIPPHIPIIYPYAPTSQRVLQKQMTRSCRCQLFASVT